MRTWWNGISLRERLIVVIASIVLSYVLLDLVLIQPVLGQRQQLKEDVAQAREDLVWMQQAVQKIPSGSSNAATAIKGSIATYVDGQISRSGLKKHLQQMTPILKHSVRVRLSDVDFNQLLKFLLAVDSSIEIEEVRILPQSDEGVVNASLILKNPKAKS
jgi:general secretion pathway protein M